MTKEKIAEWILNESTNPIDEIIFLLNKIDYENHYEDIEKDEKKILEEEE